MMKAGLIDEMMNDAIDSTLDSEDVEEETEDQISQVLDAILTETVSSLPAAKVRRQRWAARSAHATHTWGAATTWCTTNRLAC